MEAMPVEVKRLSPNATLPTRAMPNSAGLDLVWEYDYVITAKSKEIIKTYLTRKIPKGCYGRIALRSRLTLNYFIDVGAGVVDFHISKGDRVVQLIFEQIVIASVVEVGDVSSTIRGDRGFGSSGI